MRVELLKWLLLAAVVALILSGADAKKKRRRRPAHYWGKKTKSHKTHTHPTPMRIDTSAKATPQVGVVPVHEKIVVECPAPENKRVQTMAENITSLWTYVQTISQPIHVHVHGGSHQYHGSPASHSYNSSPHSKSGKSHRHTHGKSHGSHGRSHRHSHGTKKSKRRGTKKGTRSPKSKKHTHGSHGSHGKSHTGSYHSKPTRPGVKETHLHIHVTVDGPKDCKDKKPEKPDEEDEEYTYAKCEIPGPGVEGTVRLRQKPGGPLEVKPDLTGFKGPDNSSSSNQSDDSNGTPSSDDYYYDYDDDDAGTLHGFHVHEFADAGGDCSAYGGHFNPGGHDHGSPKDDHKHAGDLGNIKANGQGEAKEKFNVTSVSLTGPDSIMGRGIVIHAAEDDMGQTDAPASKKSGNAGDRIACCVISWAKPPADDDDW